MHTRRLEAASDIRDMLQDIFRSQKNAFKINLAFGFILSNVETGEKRYYYPLQNGLIYDQPLVVADEADLQRVLQLVGRRIGSSTSDNRSPTASGASPCSPT